MELFPLVVIVPCKEVLLEVLLKLLANYLSFFIPLNFTKLLPLNQSSATKIIDKNYGLLIPWVVMDLEIFLHSKDPCLNFLSKLSFSIKYGGLAFLNSPCEIHLKDLPLLDLLKECFGLLHESWESHDLLVEDPNRDILCVFLCNSLLGLGDLSLVWF